MVIIVVIVSCIVCMFCVGYSAARWRNTSHCLWRIPLLYIMNWLTIMLPLHLSHVSPMSLKSGSVYYGLFSVTVSFTLLSCTCCLADRLLKSVALEFICQSQVWWPARVPCLYRLFCWLLQSLQMFAIVLLGASHWYGLLLQMRCRCRCAGHIGEPCKNGWRDRDSLLRGKLLWAQGATHKMVCTLAPPGKYDWMIVCGSDAAILSVYFHNLLLL